MRMVVPGINGEKVDRIPELGFGEQFTRVFFTVNLFSVSILFALLFYLAIVLIVDVLFLSRFGLIVVGVADIALFIFFLLILFTIVETKDVPKAHVGVPVLLGARIKSFIMKEGMALSVKKEIFSFIPVDITLITVEFPIEGFCFVEGTGGNADSKVGAAVKCRLDLRVDKFRAYEFIDAGGKEDVRKTGTGSPLDAIITMVRQAVETRMSLMSPLEVMSTRKEFSEAALWELYKNSSTGTSADESCSGSINVSQKDPLHMLGFGVSIYGLSISSPSTDIDEDIKAIAKEEFQRSSEITDLNTKLTKAKMINDSIEEAGGEKVPIDSLVAMLGEFEMLEKGQKVTPGMYRLLAKQKSGVDLTQLAAIISEALRK